MRLYDKSMSPGASWYVQNAGLPISFIRVGAVGGRVGREESIR